MRISVIIPCYNVERYVERAVRSVLAQTHADVELIAVDDGSTDGTRERLVALRATIAPQLRVVAQVNLGACAARNTGLRFATGTYVQFLDADDELLPTKLAHQAEIAKGLERPTLIVGSCRIMDPAGHVVKVVQQHTGAHDDWMDLMAHGLNITSPNLWERVAVISAGGWTEGLGSSQEYDLMFRLLQRGAHIVHDDQELTIIHERGGDSISQTNLDRNWIRFVELRGRILEHITQQLPDLDPAPYQQVLFDSIRTLHLHDPTKANELFQRYFPKGYLPSTSPATGRGYLILHRMLGFRWANRVRSWWR